MRSHLVTTTLFLLLAGSFGCTKAGSTGEDGVGAKPRPQPQPQGDVTVELSSVTLGDDCGGGWAPPPPANRPAQPAAPARQAPPAPPSVVAPSEAPADCAQGDDCGGGGRYQRCQQTSIQLALHAAGSSSPTPIRIKKVELLDAKGTLISELVASTPTRWSDAGSYQTWDQLVAPGEHAAVSYLLSSPNWHAMEGGQYAQTGKTFQVRVTLLVGAKDRVVEKQAIQPTIMPPAVPT